MADIATLVLKVDSTGVKQGTSDVDRLTRSGNTASQAFTKFSGIIAGIGFMGAARAAIRMSDDYTKLTAQLKIATTSQEEFGNAMNAVKRISATAQADINTISILYARLSNSLRDVGVSQKEIADISETVALALKVNGASAGEASSAMLQLSQAFGSGVLRGEEFNALMEASPNLMRALAESIGVPMGQLRSLASEGAITGDVLTKAFTDPRLLAKLREQSESVKTLSGAFVTLKNAVMEFTGVMTSTTGSASASSEILNAMANQVQKMVNRMTALKLIAREAWIALAGDTSGKQVVTGEIKRPAPAYQEPDYDMKYVTRRFAELNDQLERGQIPLAKYHEGIKKMYEDLSPEKKKGDFKQGFDPEGDFWFAADEAAMKNQQKRNEEYLKDLVKAEEEAQQQMQRSALEAQRIIADTDPIFKASLAWEDLTELVDAGLLSAEQAGQAYAKTFEGIDKSGNDAFKSLENAVRGWGTAFTDEMTKMIRTGKMSFSSLADSIINDLIRIQVQKNITGPLVKAGTSFLDSFDFGSIFGGGKATGGPVSGGTTYLVGERGPELFTPSGSGNIIPNHKLGGTGGVTVNSNVTINAPNASAETVSQIRALMPAFIAENSRVVVGAVNQALVSRGQQAIRA